MLGPSEGRLGELEGAMDVGKKEPQKKRGNLRAQWIFVGKKGTAKKKEPQQTLCTAAAAKFQERKHDYSVLGTDGARFQTCIGPTTRSSRYITKYARAPVWTNESVAFQENTESTRSSRKKTKIWSRESVAQ